MIRVSKRIKNPQALLSSSDPISNYAAQIVLSVRGGSFFGCHFQTWPNGIREVHLIDAFEDTDQSLCHLTSSNSLNYNHLSFRGSLAQGFSFGIFVRSPPGLRLLDRRELDDHESLGRPITFEGFNFAAAHQDPPAIQSKRGRHHGLVVFVTGR